MVLYGFSCSFFFELLKIFGFRKAALSARSTQPATAKYNPASRTHDCNRWGRSDLYLFVQHRPLWSATQRESMCIYTGGWGVQTFRLKGQNRNLTANTYRNMLHRVE